MTLARRLCAVLPCDDKGRPVRRFEKGGLDVDFLEAIAAWLERDGADEIWLKRAGPPPIPAQKKHGSKLLFEPLKILEQQVFIPLVAWAPVQSPSDARLLLGFGADRVVVDARLGLPDPLAFVARVVDATGPDRVSCAVHFRRVAGDKGVAFELVDTKGEGTGINALSLIDRLPAVGACEIVVVPVLRAPESERVVHDGEFIEQASSTLSVPLLSVGDDREITDVATPLLMGADGIVTELFAGGKPTVPDAWRALSEYGLPVRA